MRYLLFLLGFGIIPGFLSTLSAQTMMWKDLSLQEVALFEETELRPKQFRALDLDVAQMRALLAQAPPHPSHSSGLILSLPSPDGEWLRFRIAESSVMPDRLAAKYPLIRTYQGWSLDHPASTIRLDVSTQGFHAMILTSGKAIMIEPANRKTTREYISYHQAEIPFPELLLGTWCGTLNQENERESATGKSNRTLSSHILEFRLALAADSLYTAYHGGVSGAMSAMVTVLNQVNGLLEQNFAIRLSLIPNNDILIFSGADPYTNGFVDTMFDENDIYLNQTIGTGNYDIGHVFTRYFGGSLGIAYRGRVCQTLKGGAATSANQPIGLFFMGTFAHEIGHQLGAPHTFNGTSGGCNANRSPGDGFEPGSGTTIMSYPGACGSHNIQNSRDLYYHIGSIQDVYDIAHIGSNCGDTIPNNNQNPILSAGGEGFFIPVSTPFELVGSGSDPDGDPLSFCWEQYDLGPAGHPNFPVGNAPLFRSLPPTSIPSRIFPRIHDIVNGTQTRGEILADYARDMTFRLTVRDNQGGVNWEEIAFNIWGNAGPFRLTYPNAFTVWEAHSFETISWDVANTQNPPVNCQVVDVHLSVDGGFTYPILLASQIPNTGFATIEVPNAPSSSCRIRIRASDNIFFDISDQNFQIIQPASAGYDLYLPDTTADLCLGRQTSLPMISSQWLGFSDPVQLDFGSLPQGVSLTFSPDPVMPGDPASIMISANHTAIPGLYELDVVASAANTAPISQTIQLRISDELPEELFIQSPLNGAIGIGQNNGFSWQEEPHSLSYTFELASSPAFGASTIFFQDAIPSPGITPSVPLASGTPYYWRVRGENICGAGPSSAVFGFQTGLCLDTASTDVPQVIPLFGNSREVFSELSMLDSGIVSDIHVVNLSGTHLIIPEISISLISPTGTEVVLFSEVCNSFDQNFSLNFDDDAWQSTLNCPPVDNGFYQPAGNLSDFIGEQSAGIWTLKISDAANFNNGELQSWGLEICIAKSSEPPQLINNTGLSTIQWRQDTITPSLLQATDAISGAAEVIFTLIERPRHGGLILNGVNLQAGDTFTQEEIDLGRLAYLNNGSSASSDAFRFDVQNADGGWIGVFSFPIEVQSGSTAIDELAHSLQIEIYPNPANDLLTIDMKGEWQGSLDMRLSNVQGQLLYDESHNKQSLSFSSRISVQRWSSGVYLLEIRTEDRSYWKKLLIR